MNLFTKLARGEDGLISDKKLSAHGKSLIKKVQGKQIDAYPLMLVVKGDKLIDEKGNVVKKIDNDRFVAKIVMGVA